jgi:hypothetical protein
MTVALLEVDRMEWNLKMQEALKLQRMPRMLILCVELLVASVIVAAEIVGFAPLPWLQQALPLDQLPEQLALN